MKYTKGLSAPGIREAFGAITESKLYVLEEKAVVSATSTVRCLTLPPGALAPGDAFSIGVYTNVTDYTSGNVIYTLKLGTKSLYGYTEASPDSAFFHHCLLYGRVATDSTFHCYGTHAGGDAEAADASTSLGMASAALGGSFSRDHIDLSLALTVGGAADVTLHDAWVEVKKPTISNQHYVFNV